MPRNTIDEVKILLPDTGLTDEALTMYLELADAIVSSYLVGKGLNDGILKQIELYLCAHAIISTTDRPTIMEKAGPTEQRFANIFGSGLLSTTWGQMALMLDETKTLMDLAGVKSKITFLAINEVR